MHSSIERDIVTIAELSLCPRAVAKLGFCGDMAMIWLGFSEYGMVWLSLASVGS
jgi:hypothetical protein